MLLSALIWIRQEVVLVTEIPHHASRAVFEAKPNVFAISSVIAFAPVVSVELYEVPLIPLITVYASTTVKP